MIYFPTLASMERVGLFNEQFLEKRKQTKKQTEKSLLHLKNILKTTTLRHWEYFLNVCMYFSLFQQKMC